jgi:hypothetical protein
MHTLLLHILLSFTLLLLLFLLLFLLVQVEVPLAPVYVVVKFLCLVVVL